MAGLLAAALPFKGPLIAGAIGLAACGLSYFVGYNRGENHIVAEQAKANIHAATQIVTQVKERQVRDYAREQQLSNQLEQARQSIHDLQGRLANAPDLNPDVRLSIGDVSVLDSAAQPGGLTGVPNSAPGDDEAFRTPSQVGLRPFVNTEVQVRGQYNDLAKRCDALVDWANEELVKPKKK